MSKNTENAKPTTEAVEAVEEPTQPVEAVEVEEVEQVTEDREGTSETDDADKNRNAEAAKYRRKLRETEAERDALAAKLEGFQRAEVEKYAEHLQKPSAIWAAGLELADLLDDEGNVDATKSQQAIQSAAEELGLMNRPRTPKPHPAQQAMGHSGIPGQSAEDQFADIIAGKRNR